MIIKPNKQFYLAHPFEMRKEIREWELEFEKRTGIQLENPFYDDPDRDDVYRMDRGEITPRTMKRKGDGNQIIDRDLSKIESNQGLVAFIQKQKNSLGTPMEIFYSSRILRRPTYVITDELAGHPWIIGLATKIFNNEEDFEKWINPR